ncbi:Protein of unknown function [Cotesia congregata]|uniref:Uncharacterized protein n=1 Tax=Cotesia congregata TaxID=51543 RepID=A0A8J2HN37_COTCN|nr:Protein of unknown function [Cotesia congregata]CAG5101876.1 Protein of unknown function [Cotesia congregata]
MIGIWHQYAVSVSRYDPLQICANQIWLPPKNYVSTVKLISRSKTTHETLKSLAEMYMTRNNVLKVNNHIPIVGNAPYEVVVLGIDYINFGITWGCMSRGQNKREEILSLYTRQVKPLIDVVKMTKKIMAEYNLTMPELVFTDQNC